MRAFLPISLLMCALVPAIPARTAEQAPRILFDAATRQQIPLPDFSYAGYGFGETPLPQSTGVVVDVGRFGATADDEKDDSVAVMAAMAEANKVKGPVVLRFPEGRFVLSEVLLIQRSDFVVEGAGRGKGGTELYFPRPLRMVDKSNRLDALRQYLRANDKRQVERARNIDEPFSEYSWSGGFIWSKSPDVPADLEYAAASGKEQTVPAVSGTAGTRYLSVADGSSLKRGDVVTIQWYPRQGRSSALLRSLYGEEITEIGSRLWENPARAIVKQTTRIMAIEAGRIQIGDTLLHDIGKDMPAEIARWQGLREVGIRDIALIFPEGPSFGHHLEEGWNGICLTDVFNGWVESVRISNADSGILTYNSASLTIRDIQTEGDRTAHYSVHVGSVHNVLVSELQVLNKVIHSLSFNTLSTRSVFQRATVWKDPVLDQHAGANHQNLFDELKLYIVPRRLDGVPTYALWDGSGAAYWQPGHGRFNTHWNLRMNVLSGASAAERVVLTGLEEGPDARIVGISGNREFSVDYRPRPYIEMLNAAVGAAPSLYDWQLAQRRNQD